jgi:PAS domain-containing protein
MTMADPGMSARDRLADRKQSASSSTEVALPVWNEKHLRAATRAAGVALWSWNVDTDAITMDERAYELWEVPKSEDKITFEILSKNIHPADLERVRSAHLTFPTMSQSISRRTRSTRMECMRPPAAGSKPSGTIPIW